MDTVTHGLFGLTIYKAIDKKDQSKELKRAYFLTAMVGSQIPDSDVISQWWDQQGQYLMWHRGITHSVFFVPLWALLLSLLCFWFWGVKEKKIFYVGLLSVFIHVTSDIFNAWGTGYLEPFSTMRFALGTIPIVDFFVWIVILAGFILNRFKKYATHSIFQVVGLVIIAHFIIQSVQGYWIYHKVEEKYSQVALSADFIPWHFKVIGKKGGVVEISDATIWSEPKLKDRVITADEKGLEQLFLTNKKAKTLYEWAPFVVVVDEQNRYGIYDPRFYQNGQSFLFEYMEKNVHDEADS